MGSNPIPSANFLKPIGCEIYPLYFNELNFGMTPDHGGREIAAMSLSDHESGDIEERLRAWFPQPAHAGAATIAAYPILPEEQALMATAVARRQAEFATGRWLSRQGLRALGIPDQPIGIGRLRNPLWPESVLGTISHDGDLCAVVLLPRLGQRAAGIGIDLIRLKQRAGRMAELATMFVADAGELEAVAAMERDVDPALLLFSIKESLIKAIAHRVDDFVDMRAIRVSRPGHISLPGGLAVSLSGEVINADLYAGTVGRFLVTAALTY